MTNRADGDLIIRLLETAERRIRRNRILNDMAAGLAVALIVPVAFKLVDLVSPFRGMTVAVFLGLWAAATVIWLATRRQPRERLEKTAARIDRDAGGHDELQTAYWFIRNPKESPWIETQIHQASQNAAKLPLAKLYERHVPRSFYAAAGLVLIFGALNFLPLSMNPNWLLLKGAPAFRLNNTQNAEMQKALQLLNQAAALHQTDIADRLAQVVEAVKNGSLTQNQLSHDLSRIQQDIAKESLNAGTINGSLEQVAKALDPSTLTKPIASGLFVSDLKDAAKETRRIEDALDKLSPADLTAIAERFQAAASAAENGTGNELKPLAGALKAAAVTMSSRSTANGRQALEQTAREFERLSGVLGSQQLESEASAQIDAVQDSVDGTSRDANNGRGSEGKGSKGNSGEGTGDQPGNGSGDGAGQGASFDGGEGDQPGTGNGAGGGGNQAGLSGPPPMRGEATELAVQLEKEALPVKPTRGSRPTTVEEASQRERSKLEYGKTPTELRQTSKDLLHPDTVPLDQQQLLKQYFETIRP